MKRVTGFPSSILYVDDETMACKYFKRAVDIEFDIMVAEGVDQALAMIEKEINRIGIVVTDYRMPGKSGAELLQEVRKRFPHLICILVTGYATRTMLHEAISASDVLHVLHKPLYAQEVNEVLRQARRMAQDRAVRRQQMMAMNEALSFLSHELVSPLAAITSYARGVSHRIADADCTPLNLPEIDRAVSAARDNAVYCLDLLSTFFAAVRREDNMLTPGNTSSAALLVSSLINTFPLTPAQRKAIRFDVAEDFQIDWLPNIVSLVLSTLLRNALEALTEQAEPALAVTVQVERTPQICITDNGPGIAPALLARLQANPMSPDDDEGRNGWRLLLCSRMMQAFGGGMSIQSMPDSGTTVTLEFPVANTDGTGRGVVDDSLQ